MFGLQLPPCAATSGLNGRRDGKGGGGRVLVERSVAAWYKGKRERGTQRSGGKLERERRSA